MRFTTLLVALLAGCAVSSADRPTREPEETVWEAPRAIGWRLTERLFKTIEEAWADAGDGEIPGGTSVLVYEALYDAATRCRPRPVPEGGRCGHEARVRYAGALSPGVGTVVEMTLWVEGPADSAHVVELVRTHPGVELHAVAGARALEGEPGRYAVDGRNKVTVSFTSRIAGPGGLGAAVVRELGMSRGRHVPFAQER